MSDCDLCEREHVCDYKYKPCDCVHYRKFLPAPMTACGSCDGSGWKPYPLRCRDCKGCGMVRVAATQLEVDDKRPITCQRRQVYDKVLNMSEISSGLVAVRIDTDGYQLVRLSDAEAIIAQKDAEILEQCRLNGMGAERELALLGQIERQSAALKLAKAAIISVCGCYPLLYSTKPGFREANEALATIDALKGE